MKPDEQFDASSGGRDKVRSLCEKVFGDDGGHLENVRLAWEVPPPDAGQPADREGWRVYECDVVGHQFFVPHGAPIPVILADHFDAEGEQESVLCKYVHPDLVEDREALLDRFLRHVRKDIRNHLAALSTSFNLLAALRDRDEIPAGSSPHPYRPYCTNDRVGYEGAVDQRPIGPEDK
jgi:hypothetical protein